MATGLTIGALVVGTVSLVACGGPTPPLARDGQLDLRGWDFERSGAATLNGGWHFFSREFLPAVSRRPGDVATPPLVLTVPRTWEGVFPTGKGFGTYRLRLHLPPGPEYAIHLPDQGTAFELYCEGQLLARSGRPGRTAEVTIPELRSQVVRLCRGTPHVELTALVANHHHRWGGLWFPIRVGTLEAEQRREVLRHFGDALFAGGLLIVAAFHLLLSFVRRFDHSAFYFAIHCVLNVIWSITIGDRILNSLWPLPWDVAYRIEFASGLLASGSFVLYAQSQYPAQIPIRVTRLVLAVVLLCVLISSVAPNDVYTALLVPFWAFAFACILFLFAALARSALRERRPRAACAGLALICAAAVYDLLRTLGILPISQYYTMQYALGFFVLAQALFVTREGEQARRRSEILSGRLAVLLSISQSLARCKDAAAAVATALRLICGRLQREASGRFFLKTETTLGWECYKVSGDSFQRAFPAAPQEAAGEPLEFRNEDLRLRIGTEPLAILDIPLAGGRPAAIDRDLLEGVADTLLPVILSLRQRERDHLVLIGEMVAEIVHDINNHCSVILQLSRGEGSTTAAERQGALEREVEFLRALTRDLLDFSRGHPLIELRGVPLSEFLQHIHERTAGLLSGTQIALEVVPPQRDDIVRIDRERMLRLFYNLATNANQAMQGRGVLQLAAESDGQVAQMSVTDNGPGLRPDALRWIFEPFASRRPGGTGLGLAIVRRLAQAHGGELLVSSRPGRTRFSLLLPVVNPEVRRVQSSLPAQSVAPIAVR